MTCPGIEPGSICLMHGAFFQQSEDAPSATGHYLSFLSLARYESFEVGRAKQRKKRRRAEEANMACPGIEPG
jgi:hypothetical protein